MADKIVLNNALGTYDVARINDNFARIAEALNEKVLYRDSPAGSINSVRNDIDMNGHRILNLAAPASDNQAARLKDVKNAIEGLSGQTANLIAFEPTATIPDTNVQGAIEQVDENLRNRVVSVLDFMTPEQIADAKTGHPTMDATDALQNGTDFLYSIGGGELLIPVVLLLKGSGGVIGGRVTDGVQVRSNVSYRWIGVGEVRLDPSCVVGFTTRLLAPVTSLADAPHDINFINPYITRPGSTWNSDLENTALLYIGAVNHMKVTGGRFIGWPGDAIMIGANDNIDLTWLNETYVQDVEISGVYFDGVTKENRQAISIFEGVDINIHHCKFTRTTRSASPAMPGAIDIEPILASAKVANIRIEDNLFDDIGGSTGVVSFALGVALDSPAHDLVVKNNTFRNIFNIADVYIMGKSSSSHDAVAAGSPYIASIVGNIHDPLSGLTPNRRYFVGGVDGLTIEDNTIYGANTQMLIGYDNGSSHYPIKNLNFNDNEIRVFDINGGFYDPAIAVFGGVHNGRFTGNMFIDCGNISGGPQSLTTIGFIGNGVQSKNIDISSNQFINDSGFSVNSVPIYAATLTYPTTFRVERNVFHGLNESAYNSIYSIYSQVVCDAYSGFVTVPSTNVPNVGGAKNLKATTGDTFLNFAHGYDGQRITLVGVGSGCVIQNNANIVTSSAANVTLNSGKVMELVNLAGVWYQV